jgi:hypothetical protein
MPIEANGEMLKVKDDARLEKARANFLRSQGPKLPLIQPHNFLHSARNEGEAQSMSSVLEQTQR